MPAHDLAEVAAAPASASCTGRKKHKRDPEEFSRGNKTVGAGTVVAGGTFEHALTSTLADYSEHYLMKSEPEDFNIDDLAKEPNQTTCWGVCIPH